jgi:hypothetical protein
MDNIVIWVAIVGVIGTLSGVGLGNYLQNRNIKQQRDRMLQDQKREWVRRVRQEEFKHILEYVENSLEYLLKAEWVYRDFSREEAKGLIIKHNEKAASALPIIYSVMGKDKELSSLLNQFAKDLKIVDKVMRGEPINTTLDTTGQHLSEVAGVIRERVNTLLEQTFNQD